MAEKARPGDPVKRYGVLHGPLRTFQPSGTARPPAKSRDELTEAARQYAEARDERVCGFLDSIDAVLNETS